MSKDITLPSGSSIDVGRITLVITISSVLSFLAIRVYRLFKKPAPKMASEEGPLPERPVTLEELSKANGESGHPLYVAIKDPFSSKVTVFDVSAGSAFYGPGNPYHVFAAKDATYGLATTSTDPEKLIGDLSNLTQSQKDTHMQWHAKFASKYPIIGYLVHASEDDTSSAVTTDTKKDV